MPQKSPLLAKLTRPTLAGVYPRARLFRLLDRARKTSVVWVSAQAGAGKTTLIADYLRTKRLTPQWYQIDSGDNDIASFFYYLGLSARALAPKRRMSLPLLTPEYRAGLAAFTTNFFRALFSHLKRDRIVVFDNYQDVGQDAKLHEVLAQGLDQIPPDAQVIVISRESPPDAFARLRASGRMTLLGWDELKLTEPESAAIAKLRCKRSPLSRAELRSVHDETQGWVAGLVLLTERFDEAEFERIRPQGAATQFIFDYFANEIFRYGSSAVREFLLKTAFLPRVSVALAQRLTDETSCESILRNLARRNYFTVRRADGSYEYHPLFRAFLINRAIDFYSSADLARLKQRCAELLAESGDSQTAVDLLQQTQDWPKMLHLIFSQASLLVAQGRTQTIETWLQYLPIFLVAQNPWALYWQGVCRLAFVPADARQLFEQAFALFETAGDASGLHLAWSGIVESIILERNDLTPLGPWLDRYRLLTQGLALPSPDIEATSFFSYISGLIHIRFDDPDLPVCVARAEKLVAQEMDISRRLTRTGILIHYFMWKGELTKMRGLLNAVERDANLPDARPLARLYWYTYKAIDAAGTGAPEDSLHAVTDGLALAKASGVYVFNFQLLAWGIWGQICAGNVAVARPLLQQLSTLSGRGRAIEAFYRQYVSIVALHEGNVPMAIEEGRLSADMAKATSYYLGIVNHLIGLAYAYTRQGDTDAAFAQLTEARSMAERMRSRMIVSFCDFCEANIRRVRGEHELSLRALREALTSAKDLGVMTPAWCLREDAASLYNTALDVGIESEFVRTIIERTRLAPPSTVEPTERWPWPVLIRTFGRFSVHIGGTRLPFSGRAHNRSLALLRMLITLGAQAVPLSRLATMLWPDTASDAAEHALQTTVYRLRKLLGEGSILIEDGHIRLNADYCWLDVWAFERIVEASDREMPPAKRAQRLLDIYRGSFFDGDEGATVIAERERLHAKFLRTIGQLGVHLENVENYTAAVVCYQRGIEIDPVAEELYRRLMHCYRLLDRPAEALAVYQRCRSILVSVLGVEPKAETQSAFLLIQQSRP